MKTNTEIILKKHNNLTWDDLLKMKPGTIIKDWYDGGFRCLIVRSTSSLTAYLGIPNTHILSGYNHFDIDIDCHWGLSFSGEGNDKPLPSGFYFYGWDYSHYGDYPFYYEDLNMPENSVLLKDKKWLPEDVEKDMWSSIDSFKKLVILAENIAKKITK